MYEENEAIYRHRRFGESGKFVSICTLFWVIDLTKHAESSCWQSNWSYMSLSHDSWLEIAGVAVVDASQQKGCSSGSCSIGNSAEGEQS